tara:strand:- start:287 stop:436 length:150 start_codon:yes stop_codon:yes gene_type:complete
VDLLLQLALVFLRKVSLELILVMMVLVAVVLVALEHLLDLAVVEMLMVA